MDEYKYKKIKKMLENRCVNIKEIWFVIIYFDVWEVYEVLMELLEILIWKFFFKIKWNMNIYVVDVFN